MKKKKQIRRFKKLKEKQVQLIKTSDKLKKSIEKADEGMSQITKRQDNLNVIFIIVIMIIVIAYVLFVPVVIKHINEVQINQTRILLIVLATFLYGSIIFFRKFGVPGWWAIVLGLIIALVESIFR